MPILVIVVGLLTKNTYMVNAYTINVDVINKIIKKIFDTI